MDVGISPPPLVTDAKTEMARLAGCSQFGQSAPVLLRQRAMKGLEGHEI